MQNHFHIWNQQGLHLINNKCDRPPRNSNKFVVVRLVVRHRNSPKSQMRSHFLLKPKKCDRTFPTSQRR
ncbi:hypothetical protein [Nostoc commune]|uniref:hypothetical protein n=1 Tax=Nostoc commune TaxID=1178 RepID=UPI0020747E71|nr:hypothetical protein [Nostoc commune]